MRARNRRNAHAGRANVSPVRALLYIIGIVCLLPLAQARDGLPGEIAELSAGESYAWFLEPGDYWLTLAAGPEGFSFQSDDGAEVPHTCPVEPTPSSTTQPDCSVGGPARVTGTTGMRIERANASAYTLRAMNGSARALIGDPVLMNAHVENHNGTGRIATTGTIVSGCRAIHITTSAFNQQTPTGAWLSGPINVRAAAPGATLRYLSGSNLETIAEDESILTRDIDDSIESGGALQICTQDAPIRYAVQMDRPPVPQENISATIPLVHPTFIFAIALAALLRRASR